MPACCGGQQAVEVAPAPVGPGGEGEQQKPTARSIASSIFSSKRRLREQSIREQLCAAQNKIEDLVHELVSVRPISPTSVLTDQAVAAAKAAV